MNKMHNSSLKKELIYHYSLLPLAEGAENNLVTVVTSGGIISGTPISIEETDDSTKFVEQINSMVADKYRKDLDIEDGKSLPGNDGFFTLKDAKLISGTATVTFATITIFFDQVAAITVGPITK